jgi:hypothetical protein
MRPLLIWCTKLREDNKNVTCAGMHFCPRPPTSFCNLFMGVLFFKMQKSDVTSSVAIVNDLNIVRLLHCIIIQIKNYER